MFGGLVVWLLDLLLFFRYGLVLCWLGAVRLLGLDVSLVFDD